MFGNHTPVSEKNKSQVSPMATLTRGTLVAGKQWKFRFPNGYGASVINDGYGHESGLYELAVLGPDGRITYDTPLTNDVLGYLNESDVTEALDKIAALTPESIEDARVAREQAARKERIAELQAELAELRGGGAA